MLQCWWSPFSGHFRDIDASRSWLFTSKRWRCYLNLVPEKSFARRHVRHKLTSSGGGGGGSNFTITITRSKRQKWLWRFERMELEVPVWVKMSSILFSSFPSLLDHKSVWSIAQHWLAKLRLCHWRICAFARKWQIWILKCTPYFARSSSSSTNFVCCKLSLLLVEAAVLTIPTNLSVCLNGQNQTNCSLISAEAYC